MIPGIYGDKKLLQLFPKKGLRRTEDLNVTFPLRADLTLSSSLCNLDSLENFFNSLDPYSRDIVKEIIQQIQNGETSSFTLIVASLKEYIKITIQITRLSYDFREAKDVFISIHRKLNSNL